ncbi:DUF1877 domain-containing protein [Streptomyces sp. NPDC058335]|uniref:DUF1877 domain-containing protein n=1 Tax=Streptomyces sp. NPDC058335 TaxID=3346451 RepID=UPI0036517757
MSAYFRLRAVPASALRNSTSWLRRLFDDDQEALRGRIRRHREEIPGDRYPDQQLLYADAPPEHVDAGPGAHVVLGGQQVYATGPKQPPFLLLTAAQTIPVAAFLAESDFDDLWRPVRPELLPRYGGPAEEVRARAAFASAHADLTALCTTTARYGDAVVKRLHT